MKDLEESLDKILLGGGEGLVARAPNSLYVRGRDPSILKVKVREFLLTLDSFNTPKRHEDSEVRMLEATQFGLLCLQ
jgi:ATP-dependent DNA ligase